MPKLLPGLENDSQGDDAALAADKMISKIIAAMLVLVLMLLVPMVLMPMVLVMVLMVLLHVGVPAVVVEPESVSEPDNAHFLPFHPSERKNIVMAMHS